VQSYGPEIEPNLESGAAATSREWYRPNPPLASIKWGPRNNTNIQESALLIALNRVARDKELYLENYYAKNKRAIEFGRTGKDANGKPTPNGWVVPARQYRKADAADLVNELRHQGAEVHIASAAFQAGGVNVAAGDYVIRADQPYRTLIDMYTSIQNYPTANPRPYDDTGWTMQYLRNVKLAPVYDKAILDAPMTPLTADAQAPGGVEGSGAMLIVEHTSDNNLMTFRMRNQAVRMLAAEEDFEAAGHKFRAGAFLIPSAERARLEPELKELGLSAWAVAADSALSVKAHELTMPRIGYVHSWARTQDEGWVRAALDRYNVPYAYFGDTRLREGNLRARYDVIVFPHTGGSVQSTLAGVTGAQPIPYRKTDLTPNLGFPDSSDDIRGGMGFEGLQELGRFVEEGGTLITEGSTSALLAEYDLASGVTVEHPQTLFARGSILRGVFADRKSPIAYGYEDRDLPVYFNQEPVLNVTTAGGGRGFGGGFEGAAGRGLNGGEGQNVAPNVTPIHISPLEAATAPSAAGASGGGQGGRGGRGGSGGRRGAAGTAARVVLRFPAKPDDMLLSGTLAGGEAIANRALAADVALGKGHIVLFALRPFWRWQTQGTYFLAFNAILNWDHLDAGKAAPEE
jgi:hypothetical protein